MKRLAIVALGLSLLGLVPVWAIYGKQPDPAPGWGSLPRPERPIVARAPEPLAKHSEPAAAVGPYLPIILTSTHVAPLVFTGSATADCQGATGTSFSFGIKYLCVDVIVDGAQGQAYRFSWSIDGRPQSRLGNSGSISSQLVSVGDGICYGPSGNCGEAIPRGSYQVSFFLNNIQYQASTAFIR